MRMVIDIGSHECGPWVTESGMRIEAMCDCTGAHTGSVRIRVRNASLPFWERRPPWAELEFRMKPPKGPTETLKWAAQELYTRTRRPSWQNWDLDDSTWDQEMDARSGAS